MKKQTSPYFEAVLARAGYLNVTSLSDPRQVEPSVSIQAPDLVLLDLMMPYISGLGIMERLSEILPEDDYVPILVLTASATRETLESAAFRSDGLPD